MHACRVTSDTATVARLSAKERRNGQIPPHTKKRLHNIKQLQAKRRALEVLARVLPLPFDRSDFTRDAEATSV